MQHIIYYQSPLYTSSTWQLCLLENSRSATF